MRWNILKELLKDELQTVGAEIGISRGKMTKQVLNLMTDIETYYCVDPWIDDEDYFEAINEHFDFNEIYQSYRNNTHKFRDKIVELRMKGTEAVKMIPAGSLDFCFIDANHLYRHIKNDIEIWSPKVRKGGLLGGHDYGWKHKGVKKAVDELLPEAFTVKEGNCWTWWIWI